MMITRTHADWGKSFDVTVTRMQTPTTTWATLLATTTVDGRPVPVSNGAGAYWALKREASRMTPSDEALMDEIMEPLDRVYDDTTRGLEFTIDEALRVWDDVADGLQEMGYDVRFTEWDDGKYDEDLLADW